MSENKTTPAPHDWHTLRLTSLVLRCCRICGTVRRADGQNAPCPGVVRVTLRAEQAHAE